MDALSEAAITAEGRNPRVFSGLEATTGKNILKTVSASLNPLSLVSWAVPSISSLATMGSGIHGKVWTLRVMCTCVCVHACAYTSLLKWLLLSQGFLLSTAKAISESFPSSPRFQGAEHIYHTPARAPPLVPGESTPLVQGHVPLDTHGQAACGTFNAHQYFKRAPLPIKPSSTTQSLMNRVNLFYAHCARNKSSNG